MVQGFLEGSWTVTRTLFVVMMQAVFGAQGWYGLNLGFRGDCSILMMSAT